MRRRSFITLLGGAAAWPLAARAQQRDRMRRIGVMGPPPEIAAVGAGYPSMLGELQKVGFTEQRNLMVEYRVATQDPERVFADAAELVREKVDLLAVAGPELPLQAALAASLTTPIVFAAINYDPIARGYVKGLAQPGGNATGFFLRQTELAEKQVELLAQALPGRVRLAVLWDAPAADQVHAAERQARSLGLDISAVRLEQPPYDFEAAFRTLAERSPQMLMILSGPLFVPSRAKIAELAIRHRLPTMSIFKLYVEAGGLMSYGVDYVLPYRRLGYYAGKVLRGANPADLPVEQPTTYELIINLKTARALGIELPTSILLRADEVIE